MLCTQVTIMPLNQPSFYTAWKAGHPVNTAIAVLPDTPVFTGSSAFADDDGSWVIA
jgi:hypothetical protein